MDFNKIYKMNERLIGDEEAAAICGKVSQGICYDLYNKLTDMLEEAQERGCSDSELINAVHDALGNVGISI